MHYKKFNSRFELISKEQTNKLVPPECHWLKWKHFLFTIRCFSPSCAIGQISFTPSMLTTTSCHFFSISKKKQGFLRIILKIHLKCNSFNEKKLVFKFTYCAHITFGPEPLNLKLIAISFASSVIIINRV